MNNKFAQFDVYDFELIDKDGNIITKLDTVNENDFIYSGNKKKLFLKISDALINTELFDEIISGDIEIKSIKAISRLRAMNDLDVGITLDIYNVNVRYYELNNKAGNTSVVTILFEILNNENDNKVNYKLINEN